MYGAGLIACSATTGAWSSCAALAARIVDAPRCASASWGARHQFPKLRCRRMVFHSEPLGRIGGTAMARSCVPFKLRSRPIALLTLEIARGAAAAIIEAARLIGNEANEACAALER